jgi:hypothetical protein
MDGIGAHAWERRPQQDIPFFCGSQRRRCIGTHEVRDQHERASGDAARYDDCRKKVRQPTGILSRRLRAASLSR